MKKQENSLLLSDWLMEWDPFHIGKGSYETEMADILHAVYETDDSKVLSLRIQEIFDFSFGEKLDEEESLKAANTLLLLKNESSCSI